MRGAATVTRKSISWLLALAALLLVFGAWQWRGRAAVDANAVLVAGGDGGGLPRAAAVTEGFDASALQAAAELARRQSLSELLVMRHEHLVLEQYAGGADAETLVDGGTFANTVVMLAAGIGVAQYGLAVSALESFEPAALTAAIATASGQSFPRFLSQNLWQPLNAAPAQWSGSTMRARGSDWLRVAGLLLHDGRFEGTQIVPVGWALRIRRPVTAAGAEPFAAEDVYFLRGPGATRLWLVPRFEVAILGVGAAPFAGVVDETRLPNSIIRALRDRQSSTGVSLNDLVPGH